MQDMSSVLSSGVPKCCLWKKDSWVEEQFDGHISITLKPSSSALWEWAATCQPTDEDKVSEGRLMRGWSPTGRLMGGWGPTIV